MINFNFKHFLKHKFNDTLSNLKMAIHAAWRYRTYDDNNRKVIPSSEYKTVFEDRFTDTLNTKDWGYGQPWGDFHPEHLYQYYDTKGELCYTSDNSLVLELKNAPKTWKKSELPKWKQSDLLPDTFTIPVGVGMLHSKSSWQYGWFEAWIQLPEGKDYWPAFWLSGNNSWPPEIDILEAYSHHGSKYAKPGIFNWFKKLNQKIQPNLHYGDVATETKQMYGARDIPIAKVTERFVQYVCLWEEDRIEIYYDGIMVFKCTDSEILEWYNKNNADQFIILNHGLHHHYKGTPTESKMLIKNVKVMQRQIKT